MLLVVSTGTLLSFGHVRSVCVEMVHVDLTTAAYLTPLDEAETVPAIWLYTCLVSGKVMLHSVLICVIACRFTHSGHSFEYAR